MVLVAVTAIAGLGAQAAAAPPWTASDARARQQADPGIRIVDLGVGLGLGAEATHIADSGHVFGEMYLAEDGVERRAFRWRRGVVTTLGGPDQTSWVTAVNPRGDAVGQVRTMGPDHPVRSVLWRRDGTVVRLEGLASLAWGINGRGTVVGEVLLPDDGEWHAAIWRQGRLQVIDDLGAFSSVATDINDRGQVVGALGREGDGLPTRPFLWRHGTMTVFANPEPPHVADLASAVDVNHRGKVLVWTGDRLSPFSIWYVWDGRRTTRLPVDLLNAEFTARGDVVGTLQSQVQPDDPELPRALRIRNGVVTDLGTLGHSSVVLASNPRGQVVGASRPSEAVEHAVLFRRGDAVDLGTLGGDFSQALDINRRGRIVGWAEDSEGLPHAVLWRVGP